MSDDDELIATAEIGDEARKFIESDLGKMLLGMAQQEIDAAREGLQDIDPSDTKAITALQNKAKTAGNFKTWLTELITNGEQALVVWRQKQDQHG